jgi:putative flippase GtrA
MPARLQDLLSGRTFGQGVRMVLQSGFSFLLGLAITSLLVEWAKVPVQPAYLTALIVCSLVNFFAFRHWIFRTAHMPVWSEAWRFFCSVLGFRLAELLAFHFLYIGIDDYRIAYVITQATSAVAKFAVTKMFVFRDRRPS